MYVCLAPSRPRPYLIIQSGFGSYLHGLLDKPWKDNLFNSHFIPARSCSTVWKCIKCTPAFFKALQITMETSSCIFQNYFTSDIQHKPHMRTWLNMNLIQYWTTFFHRKLLSYTDTNVSTLNTRIVQIDTKKCSISGRRYICSVCGFCDCVVPKLNSMHIYIEVLRSTAHSKLFASYAETPL